MKKGNSRLSKCASRCIKEPPTLPVYVPTPSPSPSRPLEGLGSASLHLGFQGFPCLGPPANFRYRNEIFDGFKESSWNVQKVYFLRCLFLGYLFDKKRSFGFSKNHVKTCPKHAQNMPKPWQTHAKNMPTHAGDMPRHAQNMSETCTT